MAVVWYHRGQYRGVVVSYRPVVLDEPLTKVINRFNGFVFPSAIKSSVASFFQM